MKKFPVELSSFNKYLALQSRSGTDRLPSLSQLSKELGVSVASLREQFEAARSIGLVEARPRTGIRLVPYSFSPAVCQSASYAIETDAEIFQSFSDLRNHLETAYWGQAVRLLKPVDQQEMVRLVDRAMVQLEGDPVQIPHQEHRELHLLIYSRLNNIFVQGLLEAYWDLYEACGLNTYTDLTYLEKVWDYHKRMVDAICSEDYDSGYLLLIDHIGMLSQRPKID